MYLLYGMLCHIVMNKVKESYKNQAKIQHWKLNRLKDPLHSVEYRCMVNANMFEYYGENRCTQEMEKFKDSVSKAAEVTVELPIRETICKPWVT